MPVGSESQAGMSGKLNSADNCWRGWVKRLILSHRITLSRADQCGNSIPGSISQRMGTETEGCVLAETSDIMRPKMKDFQVNIITMGVTTITIGISTGGPYGL